MRPWRPASSWPATASSGGAIGNDEPGIEWLRRLRRHFDHSVWLNTISESDWERAYGSVTIRKVREVFPMFELTVDGLAASTRKLMVKY